jgi:Short C-terminal domain
MHNISVKVNEACPNLYEPPSIRSSIADELTKLGKLKQGGIISEQEFARLKSELLNGRK